MMMKLRFAYLRTDRHTIVHFYRNTMEDLESKMCLHERTFKNPDLTHTIDIGAQGKQT